MKRMERLRLGSPLVVLLVAGAAQGALARSASAARAAGGGQEDEFTRSVVEERHALEDAKKRYFLMRAPEAEAPKEGFKLLLVLPGGDGSAEFQPFVRRIFENALGADYLLAQLVAPVWSSDQSEQIVWPVEKNPWPKMEFSTEAFLDAVIADVEAAYPLDADHVFTLGWSSGGPPVYAYSVHEDSRATGSFVAMSVFKPGQMDSLKNAKGHAYFLLHSPEDFIPIAMAEDAVEKLEKKKAKVELRKYAGGHGWRGDVYGNIRAGIAFLEKEHAKGKKSKAPR